MTLKPIRFCPDWASATLAELTAATRPICYGVLKPGEHQPDGIPLVRIVDIAGDRLDLSAAHRISRGLDGEFPRSRLKGGEVLLSIQGTIGRVAIAPAFAAGANVSRTIGVIDVDGRATAEFVRYWLMWTHATNQFKVGGTTRNSLNIGDIRQMRCPLPTEKEQQRIVELLEGHLSRLDAASASVAKVRAKAARFRRSLFLQTFGPRGLVGNNAQARWRTARLEEVAQVRPGRTPKKFEQRLAEQPREDRCVPFFKVGDMNLTNRYMSQSRTYLAEDETELFGVELLRPGTLVFPKAGGAIATNKKRVLEVAGAVDLNCMAVVANEKLQDSFLYWFFESLNLSDLADGTVLPQIGKRRVNDVVISFPEDPAEQIAVARSIEEQVSRLDAVVANADRAEMQCKALRRSLLQAAFTGKLTEEWRGMARV